MPVKKYLPGLILGLLFIGAFAFGISSLSSNTGGTTTTTIKTSASPNTTVVGAPPTVRIEVAATATVIPISKAALASQGSTATSKPALASQGSTVTATPQEATPTAVPPVAIQEAAPTAVPEPVVQDPPVNNAPTGGRGHEENEHEGGNERD